MVSVICNFCVPSLDEGEHLAAEQSVFKGIDERLGECASWRTCLQEIMSEEKEAAAASVVASI